MRELVTAEETLSFCAALSSPLRLGILRSIHENPGVSLSELAREFHVSRAAITQNTQSLTKIGLIELRAVPGKRGIQKMCFLTDDSFVINLDHHVEEHNMYQEELPIGQFTSHQVLPTCGIATSDHLIGIVDDPRYFDSPERAQAGILWLGEGYITYRLANYLTERQRPIEIQLSMEISSEAPGVAECWPSDIHFYVNDVYLGYWTSPGDFGEAPGRYTPQWWYPNWNQYGLLKLLSINQKGTFIDGGKISEVTIDDLAIDYKSQIELKFLVGKGENVGGLTLFGRGFGNYNQDIRIRVISEERASEAGGADDVT